MASCLITNPGNSANTDLIRQAKERSYLWTNKQKCIICEFIANDFVKLNDMNLTNTRTTLFVVGRQLSTSDSTQAPNFEAPMSYKQKWMRNRKVNHDFYTGNSIELFHVKLGLISELYYHSIVQKRKERKFWPGKPDGFRIPLEFFKTSAAICLSEKKFQCGDLTNTKEMIYSLDLLKPNT